MELELKLKFGMSDLSKAPMVIKDITEIVNRYNGGSISTGEGEEGPYNVSVHLLKEFMLKASKKTKDFLKVFAENEGVGKVQTLLDATGGTKYQDLRGVQSGISRRLRKLSEDEKLVLLGWEEDEADKYEGYFYVSKKTVESLRAYFKLN